ncbi:hypothetical protein NRK67_16725 (plasmid) [Fusobacteria bacterium ZRK30]|nr:hypothetical protein NRK67_16725 [Fusobacteria bacterium ZRK30]
MKKIIVRFEDLFCDFCTYDIQMVLKKYSQIENFKINRNINMLEIYFKKNKKFQLEAIIKSFEEEGLKVVEVIGG